MLPLKSTAAGLAAGLFIAGSACAAMPPAHTRASETPAEIDAFNAMTPKVSLADAAAAAENESSGRLLQIGFSGAPGRTTYNAVLLSGSKLVAETIDPLTGIASPPAPIAAAAGQTIRREQSAAEGMVNPGVTVDQAIDKAQQAGKGQPIEAWLTTHDGKAAYAVGVVEHGNALRELLIDPTSGKLAMASPKASTVTAVTHARATMAVATGQTMSEGDREVRALNLLEAQGYRDFSSVRRSGPDFDIHASRDGKRMMIEVDPDSGRLVNRV